MNSVIKCLCIAMSLSLLAAWWIVFIILTHQSLKLHPFLGPSCEWMFIWKWTESSIKLSINISFKKLIRCANRRQRQKTNSFRSHCWSFVFPRWNGNFFDSPHKVLASFEEHKTEPFVQIKIARQTFYSDV